MAQANIQIVLSNGAKAGETLKELTQSANRLNREIKDLKPGSQEFVNKTKDFQQVTGRLKDVRGQVKGVATEQKGLNAQFLQFVPFGAQVQNVVGHLGIMRSTLGGVTGGFKLLKTAIAATGIGLLLTAFGSLVAFLGSTQEGMDKLNAVMKPLSAIFQRFIGLLQDLGGSIFKKLAAAIKDPIGAFKELGQIIEDNAIKRFEALGKFGPAIAKLFKGDLVDGFKDLGNATLQLGTGVEDVIGKVQRAGKATKDWFDTGVEAGNDLFALQKKIEETEITLTTARAKLNEEYQKAKEIAQDQSQADEVRKKAAEDAQAAQNKLLDMEQHFLDLKIEKMKKEQALNDTSRADYLELAKLEAERTEFAAQAARKRSSARVLENTVDNQIAAARLKRDKEIADQEKAFQDELVNAEKANQQEIIDGLKEVEAARKQGHEDELADIEATNLEKQNQLTIQLADQQITEADYQQQISDNQRLQLQKRLQAQKDFFGSNSKEAKKAQTDLNTFLAQKYLEDAQAKKEAEQQKKDAQYAAVQGTLAIASNVFGGLKDQYKEGSKAYKAFAYAQGQLDVISAALGAYKSTAEIPVVGPALAPFAAAAALIFGEIKLNQIKRVKAERGLFIDSLKGVKRYAGGGMLRGPRHAQGGIPAVVRGSGQPLELEGGEVILTRGVGQSATGLAMASDLNAMYGGMRFMESGGPVNPVAGTSVSDATREVTSPAPGTTGQDIGPKIDVLIGLMAAWPTTLQVHNNVQDTQKGIKVINDLQDKADF